MGHQTRRESTALTPRHHDAIATAPDDATADLSWPFGKLDTLDADDLRETAYEIFFTACRSSPGFGGRNALTYYSSSNEGDGAGAGSGPGSPARASHHGVGMAVTSKVKRALGLKMLRRGPTSRRTSSCGTNPSSPNGSSPKMVFSTMPAQMRQRRPMTSAEIMRQQMRVTEQRDNRLRKTLMRTLVGQMGRRAETIILPLELLRQLKPSEFPDTNEYHTWQKRQLKILEAGLILHPSVPLDNSNTFAIRFKDIVRSSDSKPIETGKNSESMRALCNCVVSLSWRSFDGSPTDVCHWADGFPFNVNLYVALLHSVFDLKDETLVLDEIDELLELMKKTWSTLGINKSMHNLCFAWTLFHQYVKTGLVESDLLCATLAMLTEVANDAKRVDREPLYVKMLGSVLMSILRWSDKRLLDYHVFFQRTNVNLMENLLPLVSSATKILVEDVTGVAALELDKGDVILANSSDNWVDRYIRSSLKNAFTKMLQSKKLNIGATEEGQEVSEVLMEIARETEELAMKEKETFSPVLKKWQPIAGGVAALMLHACYGTLLKQFMAGVSSLTNEAITVLQRAGKLEKVLVQMLVEVSVECEDGGKTMVQEMLPYEVDSIILRLLRLWIQDRFNLAKDCLLRAKETETWSPKSKTEPYAQSSVELMKHAKEAINDLFEIPIGISDELVHNLVDGLEHIIRDYTTFVASCGSKQSYLPALPPLTRCSRDSKFIKLWKKASPCTVGLDISHLSSLNEGHHPRPSTSRGTQRLYIRLNTLHYLLSQLHSLDKTLSVSPSSTTTTTRRQIGGSSPFFDHATQSIQSASQHVSEVAAYRLIFLDSNSVFYDSLYVGNVDNARIRPALRILKQNLTLLGAIVTDRAQPLAIKEVMKASFDAYLMVLLAGGSSRTFLRTDHEMIEEDFDSLKRIFCTSGEGLIAEDVVDREAEPVEGVVALMGQTTEQLVEDFSIVACEASGIGMVGEGQKLPMPPTTGRWNRGDPNTILRVICHRNDRAANLFLKRTFQLAKRK